MNKPRLYLNENDHEDKMIKHKGLVLVYESVFTHRNEQ